MAVVGVTVSEQRDFPQELRVLERNNTLVPISSADLKEKMAHCDILYLWDLAYDHLYEALLDAPTGSLSSIYVARQGKDQKLQEICQGKGVKIAYAENVFSDTIAEYAAVSLMMLSKNLHITASQKKWDKQYNLPIAGSTALLLGRGSISQQLKKVLLSMGVVADSIGRETVLEISTGRVEAAYGKRLSLIDHIVCCLPHDSITSGVLGINFFSYFKNANFVNVSRGAVLNIADLISAIDKSYVRAALLDAFTEEPLKPSSRLWSDDRIVVSPHQAYRSWDWAKRLHSSFIDYLNSSNDKMN